MAGKTALITGGTKGIGLGIAEKMIAAGMNVVITGRDDASTSEVAKELSAKGPGRAIGVGADAKKMEDQVRSVQAALDNFGSIDVLIANAGVGHFASIEDMTPEQWNETIDLNLTGVFYSVKAALEAIKKSQGYIITIASLAGTNFFPTASAYNASKFGLVGFTQAIMLDLRQYGVKCTTIMPGSVATYFNNHTPSEADAWKIQPEDLGQMVMDLLAMHPRTLPSKIEVRPSMPPKK
jgi:3-oxoacyl-[acyl-carrier protein] reductase